MHQTWTMCALCEIIILTTTAQKCGYSHGQSKNGNLTLKQSVATHGCCNRSLMDGSPDLMAAELNVNSNTDPETEETQLLQREKAYDL